MDAGSYVLYDINEHISCSSYSPNSDQSLVEILSIPEGETVLRSSRRYEAVFLQSGKILFSRKGYDEQIIQRRRLFFLSPGMVMAYKAIEPAYIIICRLNDAVKYCKRMSLEILKGYFTTESPGIYTMPFRRPVTRFVEGLAACVENGLRCETYLMAKHTEMMYLLRGYYSKEELAQFFRPLLGNDTSFRASVLKMSGEGRNISEMAQAHRMSLDGFRKRFNLEFGNNPKEYFMKQKKELIVNALRNDTKSFSQIAQEYGFTGLNALNKFCKLNIGLPPTQIRKK